MRLSQRAWIATMPVFVIAVAAQSGLTPAQLKTDAAAYNALFVVGYMALSVWVALTAKGAVERSSDK